jgi:ABC-type sugar transport system substrate-binding protein
MFSRKLVAACAALAVTVVIVAGCSSGKKSSGSSTTGAGSATSGSAPAGGSLQATAEAKVADFKRLPTKWASGTTPFEPGTGKAAVMGCGSAAAICNQQGVFAVDALHAMGWQSGPPVDGQFSPQVESGFIDRAVQDKLDGVILISVNVNTIKPSVDRAVAAGVRITCVVCVSGAEWKGKVIDVGPSYEEQGTMAAWAIMAAQGGKAKVATFVDKQFVPPQVYGKALGDTLKSNCPTCTFDPINFSGANAAKPGPPEWLGYLASHPKGAVTDVVGEYDALSLSVARTNAQAGRTEIAVGGYNGDEPNLVAMIKGTPRIDFTVAYGYTYFSWTAADVLGRWKAGLPVPQGLDQMPNMLVTKDNAAELLKGNPKGSTFPAPAGDWQGNYRKLWGKA